MKKLVSFGLIGLVIGILIAFILLIIGNPVAETVHSWGNLVTMDGLIMGVFLKIKSMTFAEVKLAIVGVFAITGMVLGMFVAAFFIVDDIFPSMMKGTLLFSFLSIQLGAISEPSIMCFYYPLIGAILGSILGAIVAAIGESFN